MKQEFYKSPVVAIDDDCEVESLRHTYWIGASMEELLAGNTENANQLYGITSTLLNYALGDAYAGWSGQAEQNKINAADRGHNVHSDIQMMCMMDGDPLTMEGWNFRNTAKENGWTIVDNEHIVSDEEMFASAIDLLFYNKEGELCIGDIKTYSESTAKQKKERTRLQCGIYKYLFEKSNPDIKVAHLYEIRLRENECAVTELPKVSAEVIDELITAYTKGDDKYKYNPAPEWYGTLEEQYIKLAEQKEAIEKQMNELKATILDKMSAEKQTTIRGYSTTVSLAKGRTTTTFDYKAYSLDHADKVSSYCNLFDEKKFLKDHGKDDDVKGFIETKTGASSLRILVNK